MGIVEQSVRDFVESDEGQDAMGNARSAPGRQQNRRVEIVVSDEDGTFPASAERRTAMQ